MKQQAPDPMFPVGEPSTRQKAAQWVRFRVTQKPSAQDVAAARHYIAAYWAKLRRHQPKDEDTLIGLPHPYLVPSHVQGREFNYDELYYWDSYFMVQGLLDNAHKDLVMGILEDLLAMFKRFGVIPNGSRTYLTGRSQPPLLTSFIFDVYNTYQPGLPWLKERIALAEKEYRTVWMGTTKPNARQMHKGLSRHYDINMTHDLAETESGWDYTPRFAHRCLDFLPVDLNALLYKYEADFARAARLLDDNEGVKRWEKAAAARKKIMDELLWDRVHRLYYDYDYINQKRGTVESLATFYPMWAGMVDDTQAAALVRSLRRFEQRGGLTTTDKLSVAQHSGTVPMQWAYPNGWAPLHFMVVQALQRYGYDNDARRIATKWLRTNLRWFQQNGVFLEKYNVVDPAKPPTKGVYPAQTGFGWTNAIFERFCQDFIDGPQR